MLKVFLRGFLVGFFDVSSFGGFSASVLLRMGWLAIFCEFPAYYQVDMLWNAFPPDARYRFPTLDIMGGL